MQVHVSEMIQNQDVLFTVDVDKDELWNLYLDSFPPGTNEIFRERREHDCSCCRQFIKSFGNVVTVLDNKIISIWDFQTEDTTYQPVIDTLSRYIHSKLIKDVFITEELGFGTDHNFEQTEDKNGNPCAFRWDHFRIDLPKRFKMVSSKTKGTIIGEYRAVKEVFQRSLKELSKESIETVLDLIAQKSLYKGDEWREVLTGFLDCLDYYHKLAEPMHDIWLWKKSTQVGGAIGKIRNHSIGVLLQDITAGTDLNEAVKKYEKIVAPINYKRPKAIFTKKMIEQAERTVSKLGLLDSLSRRFATIDDITINNILFANKDATKRMGSIFEELKRDAEVTQKNFDRVEEVNIVVFMRDILPNVSNIELLLENKHEPNLVSLVSSNNKNAKTMFKWNNNFSWVYNGNITDSMKERVKRMGGKVDGMLRFSIQWNDNGDNNNDFDAHCIEPNGNEIFYRNKKRIHKSSGILDVDIVEPIRDINNGIAVENIIWTNENRMPEGLYKLFVHVYSDRGGRSGFAAEVEFNNQIYSFEYRKPVRQREKIPVAVVQYSRAEGFKIVKSLDSSLSSRKIWKLNTNQFYPVSVLMFSPNYWDEQKGIGHKHYFFMIDGCVNNTQPNGFFNEFLKEDLMKHKRVFEALGSKMGVEDNNNQLSGLGFSSTKRNSIICKLSGNFTRTIKLTF